MVKNGKEAIILYHYIEQQAVLLQPYLAELRKDLHRHPETAWEEERTTEKIAGILSQAGYEIVRGTAVAGHQTGVIATLHGPDPAGPVTPVFCRSTRKILLFSFHFFHPFFSSF